MDARSQMRAFVAILLSGMGILLALQLLLNDYMDWYSKPWDIFIFLPIQYLWIRFGAPWVADRLIKKD